MYSIEVATLDDYKKIATFATESGKPDYQMLKDSIMSKLVVDGEIVALAGFKDMMLPDDNGDTKEWRVLACMFRRDLVKYTKTVVKAGREYLKTISGKPILALAVSDNKVFTRFIEFMEFTDTKELVKSEDSDIMYRMYVRL